MKKIAAPKQDFDIYIARPDTEFVERTAEPLQQLYSFGYLPYSGAKNVCNVFYSARSARVVLKDFALTSENRRIAKKFDGLFTKERVANLLTDKKFYDFCLSYFAQTHGVLAMPRERLETIINSGLITSTTIYRSSSSPVAYVLEVADGSMGHYWFSFYDTAYARQSLGLWLMLDALRDAKARGLEHYYLGTVYGDKALYKTNFEPLEWLSGSAWSKDITLLKELSRKD